MIGWAWLGLTLFVQWFILLFFPERCAKGRILTRPFSKLTHIWPPWVRTIQLFVFYGVYEAPARTHLVSRDKASILYLISVIALYLDDYLTGDDDKWKKFWEGVKNKIKWKMELPVPQEE